MTRPIPVICDRCGAVGTAGEDIFAGLGDLLDFEPVPRKIERVDGWTPECQLYFIAVLAVTGSPRRAAKAVRRSAFGAERLREAKGAEGFSAAWDRAMAVAAENGRRRLSDDVVAAIRAETAPPLPESGRRTERLRIEGPPLPDEEEESAASEEFKGEVFDNILRKYQLKLAAEREARLDGRIVEADFYVRQLTYIEVLLDLAGRGMAAHKLLETLRGLTPEMMMTVSAAATPMSLLLDALRRNIWREKGEPDRFALPPLGFHQGGIATGQQPAYMKGLDGEREPWDAAREAERRLAAEAQRLWEEKARADAEEWRVRVEGPESAET